MASHVRFVVGATLDLDDATAWYESQRPGLGNRLFAAVGFAVASVVRWPNSGRPVGGASVTGVREVPIAGFPYRIVYRSNAETIRLGYAITWRGTWADIEWCARVEPRDIALALCCESRRAVVDLDGRFGWVSFMGAIER